MTETPSDLTTDAHFARLYDEDLRAFACHADTPAALRAWAEAARPAFRRLLGLSRMAEELDGHVPAVTLDAETDAGDWFAARGCIATEPGLSIPFRLLRPKNPGPHPIALCPHGHARYGMDVAAGLPTDDCPAERIAAEDRDVAVQAVRRGYLAIAPTTRGFAPVDMPDRTGRHGGSDCRSWMLHALLAGRVLMGERAWDMERLLDWAVARPDTDPTRVLVLGNSAGGLVTLYAAACDIRITDAVASCCVARFVRDDGAVQHCDCDVVPGMLRWGEMQEVGGLVAPRRLLVVHGDADPLFEAAPRDEAVDGIRRIYAAAGAPEAFAARIGRGGHRFYADLMWPFLDAAKG
ncbi:MAG: alpha/beta hydrolase family protein [Planctomycetota bacterium]